MLTSEVTLARERLVSMFGNLTTSERRELAAALSQAALDTMMEVTSAVSLGGAAFDRAYGRGLAMQYVNMAHDQVMTLVDLAITGGIPTR